MEQHPIIPLDLITEHIIWHEFAAVGIFLRTCRQLRNMISGKFDDLIKSYSYKEELLLIDGYIDVYTVLPNDKRHGKYELYDNKDVLEASGMYFNDKLEGKYTRRISRRRKINGEYTYLNGIKNGPYIKYQVDSNGAKGNIMCRKNYVDDKLHGEVIEYYPNQMIKSKKTYNMGVPDGQCATYFDDGVESSSEYYVSGVIHGVSYELDTLTRELSNWIKYDNGVIIECKDINQLNGCKRTYTFINNLIEVNVVDQNGGKISTYTMDFKGAKQGYRRLWNGNVLISEACFVDDLMVGMAREWNNQGVLLGECFYERGLRQGLDIEYHPNGAIWMKTPYIDGIKNGKAEEYDQNGAMMSAVDYIDDYKSGQYVTFWPNGNKRLQRMYYRNRLHGLCNRYDIDGNIISSMQYYMGESK
ncbi:MORN repeat-containing protein [Faustovirus ST1]|nr:MORN repeat-containing protein [Faustovirus ST1]